MNEIKKNIGNGELDKAIQKLRITLEESLVDELVQIESRLSELKRKIRLGICSNNESTLERNKISNSLVELVKTQENRFKSQQYDPLKKHRDINKSQIKYDLWKKKIFKIAQIIGSILVIVCIVVLIQRMINKTQKIIPDEFRVTTAQTNIYSMPDFNSEIIGVRFFDQSLNIIEISKDKKWGIVEGWGFPRSYVFFNHVEKKLPPNRKNWKSTHKKVDKDSEVIYYGEVIDGKKEGFGVSNIKNPAIGSFLYKGYFKNNLKNGWGIFQHMLPMDSDNILQLYIGDYYNGDQHGMGFRMVNVIDSYTEIHEGAFENDKAHGEGINWMINSVKSLNTIVLRAGKFFNGKLHGKGVRIILINNGMEIGQFEDGQFENGEFISGKTDIGITGFEQISEFSKSPYIKYRLKKSYQETINHIRRDLEYLNYWQ